MIAWVELPLDAAMAWVQQRIQGRRRRAEPDPRGLFSATRHPVARALPGSSYRSTRRWLGYSSESRDAGVGRSPTHGVVSSDQVSSGECPSWVEHCSTRRRRGYSEESRNAGVGRSPTQGGCFQRLGIQWRVPFVGRATARRGDGLGTAANPGTRASGGARPTGVVFSDQASSCECPSWVEHCSTRRRRGHSDESRNAAVGRSPTQGGSCARPRIHASWSSPAFDARLRARQPIYW